jgi:solute carrier family 25 oxoglutarate transporter 11
MSQFRSKEVNLPTRMALSAIAGMGATTITFPLDVLKFQLQMDNAKKGEARMYSGTFDCAKQLVQRGGVGALYKGLSAAYLRQWMYGSGRMGIYSYLFNEHKKKNDGALPSLGLKLAFGATAGSIGSFFGNPADIALVRMAADQKKPVAEQANYRGVSDVITRIVKADGVQGLWKGSITTMARAAVMGSCLNGVTSQTRQYLSGNKILSNDGYSIMIVSSAVSSVVANTASMPLDVVKNRYQNSMTGEYSSAWQCGVQSVKAEGPLVLWKGFIPCLLKLTPYTVLSLTFLEKITTFVTGTNAM